jgi:hypothetical protein
VVSRELRKVSVDYRRHRREARQANEEVRKMLGEVRYFEALDHRLAKGVSTKRKELTGVQSIRERYLGDLRRVRPSPFRRRDSNSSGRKNSARIAH